VKLVVISGPALQREVSLCGLPDFGLHPQSDGIERLPCGIPKAYARMALGTEQIACPGCPHLENDIELQMLEVVMAALEPVLPILMGLTDSRQQRAAMRQPKLFFLEMRINDKGALASPNRVGRWRLRL